MHNLIKNDKDSVINHIHIYPIMRNVFDSLDENQEDLFSERPHLFCTVPYLMAYFHCWTRIQTQTRTKIPIPCIPIGKGIQIESESLETYCT